MDTRNQKRATHYRGRYQDLLIESIYKVLNKLPNNVQLQDQHHITQELPPEFKIKYSLIHYSLLVPLMHRNFHQNNEEKSNLQNSNENSLRKT